MTPFEHGDWHAWQGTAHILVSDESIKKLHYFDTTDAAINWLFLKGHQVVARALNKHVKSDLQSNVTSA